MKTMATRAKPSARAGPSARGGAPPRRASVSTVPSARTRSSTSTHLRHRAAAGLTICLAKICGACLVADLERVAKAARGDQRRPLALALEQRVGGDRRPHLDRADQSGRDRRAGRDAEQAANALAGRIAIGVGILRQELDGMEPTLRIAPTISVKVPPRSIQKSQERTMRVSSTDVWPSVGTSQR